MAYISESSAAYPVGITQIETNEPAVGGQGGVANRAPQQLANRTAWLKAKVEGLLNAVGDTQFLSKMKALDGQGSGLDADLIRGLAGDFSRDFSNIGYQKLPGGLILQWGEAIGNSSGVVTINLPIAFPTKVLNVQATDIAVSDSEGRAHIISVRRDACTATTLKFLTVAADSSFESSRFEWSALGH